MYYLFNQECETHFAQALGNADIYELATLLLEIMYIQLQDTLRYTRQNHLSKLNPLQQPCLIPLIAKSCYQRSQNVVVDSIGQWREDQSRNAFELSPLHTTCASQGEISEAHPSHFMPRP